MIRHDEIARRQAFTGMGELQAYRMAQAQRWLRANSERREFREFRELRLSNLLNEGDRDMTTYTILSGEGEMIETGLSLRDAAAEVLTSDSREFEVREDKDGGFTLWARQQVANRPWTATKFFSIKTDREAAELEIFEAVVTSERFSGHSEAITDDQYAEMLANLADDGE